MSDQLDHVGIPRTTLSPRARPKPAGELRIQRRTMKTKSGVSLGISLPYSFPNARVDHEYIRRFVRRAEALGFDDGRLTEGILNPNFVLEPVTYIAHLAALTEKIRFGISVIILNYRNPNQLA